MLQKFLFGLDITAGRISRRTWLLAMIFLLSMIFLPGSNFLYLIIFDVLHWYFLSPISLDLIIWFIVLIIFSFFTIKRFHDRSRSGWFFLLFLFCNPLNLFLGGSSFFYNKSNQFTELFVLFFSLLPVLLILIDCGFLKGTTGPNQYGPDPLDSKENSQSSLSS